MHIPMLINALTEAEWEEKGTQLVKCIKYNFLILGRMVPQVTAL